MLQGNEKGSLQARLALLRLGLMAVTAIFIATLLTGSFVIYQGFSRANEAVEGSYSFSDYVSDIGPLIGLASLITIVMAVVVYFGYRTYLLRQS